jgi:Ca2+-binding EF-hand superfamily protein
MRTFVSWASLAALVLAFAGVPTWAADDKPKPDPEQLFTKMDTNADGKLSEEEFVGKRTGEKADKAKARFAKLDKDGDKSLSKDEFLAGFKKK